MVYNERFWYRQRDWMLALGGRRVAMSYRKLVDGESGTTTVRELYFGPLRLSIEGSLRKFGKDTVKVFLGQLKSPEAVCLAMSLVVVQGGEDRAGLGSFAAGVVEGLVEEEKPNGVSGRESQVERVVMAARELREQERITDLDLVRALAGCGLSEERIAGEMKVCVNGRSKQMAVEVFHSRL